MYYNKKWSYYTKIFICMAQYKFKSYEKENSIMILFHSN